MTQTYQVINMFSGKIIKMNDRQSNRQQPLRKEGGNKTMNMATPRQTGYLSALWFSCQHLIVKVCLNDTISPSKSCTRLYNLLCRASGKAPMERFFLILFDGDYRECLPLSCLPMQKKKKNALAIKTLTYREKMKKVYSI